jgi:hypothetical protein
MGGSGSGSTTAGSTATSSSDTIATDKHQRSGDGASTDPVDVVTKWLGEWGAQRCGKRVAGVAQAWSLLAQTVYAAGQTHVLHHIYMPEVLPTHVPNDEWYGHQTPWRGSYDISKLRTAWELLVAAAPDCVGAAVDAADVSGSSSGAVNNAFGFDIADVGREYLTILPAIKYYDCLTTDGFAKGNAAAVKAGGAAAVTLLHDLDGLLSSQQGTYLRDS